MLERFQLSNYTIRRKVLKLIGGAFHIFGPDGELVFYSKQKAFKIREDIRLYTDESMTEEILWIQARNIIDFAAAYDVFDSVNNEKVGALRRKGWGSMFRDHWIIMDADDNEVGQILEDSGMMAFLRRFLSNLIPQEFYAEVAGGEICHYKQHFNPFVYKLDVSFTTDANAFDRIIGIAGGILLAAIEGRQN
ncbi:MAG: hypothetical protein AB7H80_18210 [Candidatus Kapaibacterium sp.]